MKILEFVPVEKMPDKPSLGPVLLDNSVGTTLSQKIGRLKEWDADYYIFRHSDLTVETPELIEPQCELMRRDNAGVGGLIGTLCLFDSCTWWNPQRNVVTVGAIMQGDGKGGSYPMLDGPGYRSDAVSVDGCFMVFDRDFVQRFEPHDFGSWRYGYDVDACLQCLQMGRNVAVLDIRCRHDSQGQMTPDFESFRQRFLDYWKPRVDFPVIKQSNFRSVK